MSTQNNAKLHFSNINENLSLKTISWVKIAKDKYILFVEAPQDKSDGHVHGHTHVNPYSNYKINQVGTSEVLYKKFFQENVQSVNCFQFELSLVELIDFFKLYWSEKEKTQANTLDQNDHDFFVSAAQVNTDQFEVGFSLIQERISQQKIQKAVPVLSEVYPKPPTLNLIIKFIKALDQNLSQDVWVYGFFNSEINILGASPELLFKVQNNVLSTMALAGTLKKDPTDNLEKIESAKQKLLLDKKELFEHQVVVDEIDRLLKEMNLNPNIGATFVNELTSLLHLKTEITVGHIENKLKDTDFIKKLIHVLHPTPALGVYPRNLNMQWFQSLPEQKERDLFGAPICYKISPDHIICLVAIRNIMWNSEKSWIMTGCGVVQDSICLKELTELENKRLAVKRSLGIL